MKVCCRCDNRFNSLNWLCPSCNYQPKAIDSYLVFAPALAEKSDGYDDDLFSQLFDLEAKNFWFHSRNQLILWSLQKFSLKLKVC